MARAGRAIGGMAVAALIPLFENGRACAPRLFGGGFVAGGHHHPIDAARRGQLLQHLFEHHAGERLPLRGGEQFGQALFGIDARFHRQDRELHGCPIARSTDRASALRCGTPDMMVLVTRARMPMSFDRGASFASARSSTNRSTKSR